MFGIGWTEVVLIALVVMLCVGPKEIPALMRKVGRLATELKTASRDLKAQIELEVRDLEKEALAGDEKDAPSPVKVLEDAGRDLVRDVTSPYGEADESQPFAAEPGGSSELPGRRGT